MISEMMRYNEELVKAGVLLELAGLQPTAKSAKIKFSGTRRTVIDGPFTESKEVVEIRPFYEAADWADAETVQRLAKIDEQIRRS